MGRTARSLAVPLGLLLVVPVAPVLEYAFHAPATVLFVAGAIAIAILADWMRRATEQVAEHVGSATISSDWSQYQLHGGGWGR